MTLFYGAFVDVVRRGEVREARAFKCMTAMTLNSTATTVAICRRIVTVPNNRRIAVRLRS